MNKISESDAELLARKIGEALQQARSVSDSEHYDHHRWITAKIQRENAWRDFWTDMSKHVSKWGAISLISGLFYALYLGARSFLHI